MNASCTLVYDLPAGHNFKTFRALCGYDSSCDSDNRSTTGTTMEFLFYVSKNEPYTFDLTQLGYAATEQVPLHDVWAKEDLGTVSGTLTTTVPSHGVRLFRLGDNVSSGIKDEVKLEPAKQQRKTAIYDLQGRRVANPQHGIYIIDGQKKVVQ